MKIDLTNKWQMLLIGEADLSDGCSVIRSILLRSIVGLTAAVVLTAVAVAALFVIAGLLIYLCSPWFGQLDVDLSMSWLGKAWWADWLRSGATFGIMISAGATAYGVTLGLLKFFNGSTWRHNKWRAIEAITDNSGARALKTISEAAYNLAHKICPKVELVLPPEVEYLNANRDTVRITLPESGLENGWITDIHIGRHVVTVWVENDTRSTYFVWSFSRMRWNEDVIITPVDESPTPE